MQMTRTVAGPRRGASRHPGCCSFIIRARWRFRTGQGGWHDGWLAAIYEVIAIGGVLVAGLYVSTRRVYLAELRDQTQRLERERDQTSALAAAVERARIAREMHDSDQDRVSRRSG